MSKPQPHRPDARKDWAPAFFAELAAVPNVTRACRIAGIARETAYERREKDRVFSAGWDEALECGVGDLEQEAFSRAKEVSDTLLIFLLKCHKPLVYRDRQDVTMDLNLKVVVEHRDRPALPEPLPGVVIESQ